MRHFYYSSFTVSSNEAGRLYQQLAFSYITFAIYWISVFIVKWDFVLFVSLSAHLHFMPAERVPAHGCLPIRLPLPIYYFESCRWPIPFAFWWKYNNKELVPGSRVYNFLKDFCHVRKWGQKWDWRRTQTGSRRATNDTLLHVKDTITIRRDLKRKFLLLTSWKVNSSKLAFIAMQYLLPPPPLSFLPTFRCCSLI